MVSRRNYLTIAMMFVILLFMFQFTGVMKEQLSEYESNEYADDTTTSFQRSDAFLAERTSADACEVIYVGEAGGAEESVVKTWCSYRKRTFFCSSSLALLDSLQDDCIRQILIAFQIVCCHSHQSFTLPFPESCSFVSYHGAGTFCLSNPYLNI